MSDNVNKTVWTSECCEETDLEKLPHPMKGHKSPKKKVGKFNFDRLANPIPAEIKDAQELKDHFRDFPYVPYAGNAEESCHSLLKWMNQMRMLSPTHGACIESKKSYALSGKLEIKDTTNAEFSCKEKTVSEERKVSFITFLNDTFDLGGLSWKHLINNNYDTKADNGNSFTEVIITKVNNAQKVKVIQHHSECCLFLATKAGKPKIIAISPQWDSEYLQRRRPKHVPVFPAYKESRDKKTVRTIIHGKIGNYNWYGRPEWISSFMYVYREFQDANYLVKQANNNFIAQAFIEIEESDSDSNTPWKDQDAVDAGFDSLVERFEENFTAKSDDPQTVMLSTRPYGAKAAFIHEFKPNTSHEFFKTSDDITTNKIIQGHQWSKRFLGENQTQGFSTNIFIDELRVKESGILSQIRDACLSDVNKIFLFVSKFLDMKEFENLGFSISSNFDNEYIAAVVDQQQVKNKKGNLKDGERTVDNSVGGS